MLLITGLLFAWNVLLTVSLLYLLRELFRLGKGFRETNAVAILRREIERTEKMEKKIAVLEGEIQQLGEKTAASLRKVGVVRFSPYSDVGGDQSFAVALLKEDASGLVFSSLHGRGGTRVYAKPVTKGESREYPLSTEEKEAIKNARG